MQSSTVFACNAATIMFLYIIRRDREELLDYHRLFIIFNTFSAVIRHFMMSIFFLIIAGSIVKIICVFDLLIRNTRANSASFSGIILIILFNRI